MSIYKPCEAFCVEPEEDMFRVSCRHGQFSVVDSAFAGVFIVRNLCRTSNAMQMLKDHAEGIRIPVEEVRREGLLPG